MADREKVMQALKLCAAGCDDTGCIYDEETNGTDFRCVDYLTRDVLELLKEQEAVKPIITPWAEDEDGNIVVAKKECGKCGYQFFTERPNFCENCGTPILWEGQ